MVSKNNWCFVPMFWQMTKLLRGFDHINEETYMGIFLVIEDKMKKKSIA